MKKLITITFLSIFTLTHAQVPSYVPTNGLVGWWPFNGNANDESGNGNNGTVNGATLTADRFGNPNAAYIFPANGNNVSYQIPFFGGTQVNQFTMRVVFKTSILNTDAIIWCKELFWGEVVICQTNLNELKLFWANSFTGNKYSVIYSNPNIIQTNTWYDLVITFNNASGQLFLNGTPISTNLQWVAQGGSVLSTTQIETVCNFAEIPGTNRIGYASSAPFNGIVDDFGIWDRALNSSEIQLMYEGCQLAITSQPQDQSVTTSVGVANFSVTSSASNPTYQWQTNLGLGFQNISNAGQYAGATTSSLTVSNLSMSNNNQVFRCIVNDGSCVDTTAEASLTIIDDAGIQTNTLPSLKLYPNPVQDVLKIEGLTCKEFEYEVLSIDGKLLQKGTSQGEIAVKELRKGNYVLRVGQQKVSFVKQ